MTSTSAQAVSFSDEEGRYLSLEVQKGPGSHCSLTVKRADGEVMLRLKRGADLRYLADMLDAVAPPPGST
jgi:hypothetical protein